MFPLIATPLLISLLLSHQSHAFNYDVHNQIGFMAETYLTPSAQWMVSQILDPEYNGSIGRAASWADTVSKTTHRYSYGWHWTAAGDDPPRICNIYPHRDCQPGGCSLSQIANQTAILSSCVSRLRETTSTRPGISSTNTTCAESLKWLVHFIGDTAQPLHNSGRAVGGNLFPVIFDGAETNMHRVWDQAFLYAHSGREKGFSQRALDPYFAGLLARTRDDGFGVPRGGWGLGGEPERAGYWAGIWAGDANALNCDVVYGMWREGMDLWGDEGYRAAAVQVLELQVAKAAWRLGGWLNGVAGKYLSAEDGVGAERGGAGKGVEGGQWQVRMQRAAEFEAGNQSLR